MFIAGFFLILNMKKKLTKYLLSIKAIKLSPKNLFTWASGIKAQFTATTD